MIETILESNEKIVWKGNYSRKVLWTNIILGTFFQILIAYVLIFVWDGTATSTDNEGNSTPVTISKTWRAIISLGLLISFIVTILNIFVQEYSITNKRVIIKSGLIGTDFYSQNLDQIRNVMLDVDLIGKIFSVGTIKIDTGMVETVRNRTSTRIGFGRKSPHVNFPTIRSVLKGFQYIEQPNEVYRYLQSQVSNRKEALYAGVSYFQNNPQDIGKYY